MVFQFFHHRAYKYFINLARDKLHRIVAIGGPTKVPGIDVPLAPLGLLRGLELELNLLHDPNCSGVNVGLIHIINKNRRG